MRRYFDLSVTALAACLLVSCSGKERTATQERIVPVKVITVAPSSSADNQNFVGTIEESVAVSLSFSGMGTVEQVLVSEGQRVAKGQLLAVLNTATAQNAYDASQAKLVQAQDAYDRLAKVHANGSLPDIKFAEIEAGLEQAKAMAAISKKSLDDCKLYAPRNGVIADRTVEAGASVMPGVEVFKLVSMDKVNVKISVSENEIGNITEGQAANVVVPALGNAVFTGKIEMKGVDANTLSHTYDVKIRIDNPQKTLLPGMVCKVGVINFRPQHDEIVVPNRAIRVSADNRRFVWLAEDNVARRKFIETGNLTNTGIVVADGLSAGDRVIVDGFTKVSEGTHISVNN